MLAILDHPRYGQDIVDVISLASQGRHQPSPGTLYPALKRLERRGYITESQVAKENVEARNGHCRRYYKVKHAGKEILLEVDKIRLEIKNQSKTKEDKVNQNLSNFT